MGLIDLIMYPVYLAVFYFIFSARRKRIDDPVLKFYHKYGFWAKALMVVPFALFNSKISPGDSYVLFQAEGSNIYQLILKNSSHTHWLFAPGSEYNVSGLLRDTNTMGYHDDEKNFMVVRITAFLSFLTFGRYLLTCLLFSLISFTGVWRLYRFFYEQYPHLHRPLAYAILFLPTFVFWCSGILKDPLCIGALGWLTYSVYEGFYKRKSLIKNIFIIIAASALISVLKIYILVSYLPFLVLYLILKNMQLIKNMFGKIALVTVIFIGLVVGGAKIMSTLRNSMVEFAGTSMAENIKERQKNFIAQENKAGSNFKLPVEFDGSVTSMVKMAPFAIATTLYRPFIWESRKASEFLTAIESLVIMLFTLLVIWKAGPVNFMKSLRDPAVFYCLSFSVLFALFVGATTLNFGTLCRYKIPCTPFYIIAFIIILDKFKKEKKPV